MNKFSKVLTGVIVAAGVSCLGGAVACTENAPNYYSLSFEGTGLDFVLQGALAQPDGNGNPFQSGTVKEGVEVSFKILVGANTAGTPQIVLNGGTRLTPDENGVYTFIINSDTVVSAVGLSKTVAINFHKGVRTGTDTSTGNGIYEERWVTYIGEDGKELGDVVRVNEGVDFKFKVKTSPYYGENPDFSLLNGTEELTADGNGFYTLADVKGDKKGEQHLSVTGLEEDVFFLNRDDCGSGTAEDPYLLSKPIDLFAVAAFVNNNRYGMSTAHFKLAEDIDMQGEKLFVIGDYSNEAAVFSGVFDGNGKTISNFYLTDEVVNQETFNQEYLPCLGLFGYAVATVPTGENPGGAVQVKNLTLDNYTVTAHPDMSGATAYVGSIAGNSIGLQITNCKVKNGTINVSGDNNTPVYIGGLVGNMEAGYSPSLHVAYDAFVQSSSSDIEITGEGLPRATGGIVGMLISAATNATSNVVNSYSVGNVSGGMYTGGIIGLLGRYSTVSNCYATGEIYSGNNLTGSNVIAEAKHAHAGGIVGYAYDDSVISTCYSANSLVEAYSASGASFQHEGNIIGGNLTEDLSSAESAPVVLYNNGVKSSGDTVASLGWSANDWDFSGELPEIKYNGQTRIIKLLIKGGASDVEKTYAVSANFSAMHSWYGASLDEYYNEGSKRTYGYFFDEACTQRVPYGFVPANESTTLFVKFADYSEVEGRYFVKGEDYGVAAYFDLTAGGEVTFRQGGMNLNGVYSYDGTSITLYDTCLANLEFSVMEINGRRFSIVGEKTANGFNLHGIALNLVDIDNSTQEEVAYKDATFDFVAVKQTGDFKCGEYLTVDGKGKYLFLENMTGLYTSLDGSEANRQFTYSFGSGNTVELRVRSSGGDTATWYGEIAGGILTTVRQTGVNMADGFSGKWTKSANSGVSFSFDGQGFVTFAKTGEEAKTVSYTAEDTAAEFDIDLVHYACHIDPETGALVVNGESYYRATGVTGSWYLPGIEERVDATFEGLGANGYGYANIFYSGSSVLSVDAQYDVTQYADGVTVRLFVDDVVYGELQLTNNYDVVTGSFYSYNQQAYYANASFYLYDNFKGVWASNAEGIETANFNGKSANEKGEVTLHTSSGNKKYSYELTDAFTGTIKIDKDTTYSIVFNEETGKAEITLSPTSDGQLARRDSWYGVELKDDSGSVYSFDGKGYIGGKVTVRGNTTATYDYAVDGSGAVTINDSPLTVTDTGFTFNTVNLSFDTGFKGEWLLSGTGKTLKIKEVGGNFKAKVSYGDEATEYDFEYNPSSGTLSYVYEERGSRMTATLSTAGKTELSLTLTGGAEDLYLNALSVALKDDYLGEYKTSDEKESWTFDGLGNSKYGSGKATNKANGVSTVYAYKVNVFGYPVITIGSGKFAFMPVTEGDGFKKQGETTAYDLVELDAINGVAAMIQEVNYAFDGVSGLYRDEAGTWVKAYDYVAISSTEADVTSLDGNTKYLAEVITSGKLTTLRLTTYADLYKNRRVGLVVTDDLGNQSEEFYIFKEDGKLYKQGDDKTPDVAVYEYTVVSAYKVNLTAIDGGKKYEGTLRRYVGSTTSGVRLNIKEAEGAKE